MARPSVDGLEHRLHDRMNVARIDSQSDDGARIASQYGVTALPTYVVLDHDGRVIYRQVGGRPDGDEIERRIARQP
jgi:thioredoxin-like negative regulator of GroEL